MAALQAAAVSAAGTATTSAEARRIARVEYLYHALTAHALNSQANLRAWLEAQGIPYRAYYIVNMILVTGDAALVEALRQRPDVARLDANPQVDGTQWIATTSATWPRLSQLPQATASPNVPYGISATRAPEVWEMGYLGQGIVVASQDTGVEWQHPALRARYRGTSGGVVEHTYNWLDGVDEASISGCADINTPCDDHGHGTHTVGTMI
jgi:subtilisin family serine protease